VELSATLRPDVLLLDLGLPDASGLDVLRALRAADVPTRTVLLTAGADREQMLTALQLGARGLVLKAVASAVLYRCIRSVMAGEYWFGHDRMGDMVEALRRLSSPPPPAPAESLTRRERQIVAAIVQGTTNRDISAQLGLSEQTVKNHISHIFDKVGVSSRLELALFALHHKVSGPDD
jgi:two-component system, NarL family, nitrate/nitrite response regulator NarL